MTGAKQWPIVAAILGVLAVIGTGVKLATSTSPLEARVDELLARENRSSSNENLQERINDLSSVQADPGFGKLPARKQRSLTERFAELKAAKSFQEFEKSLAEIPDPKTARSISQLREISQRLSQLQEPENLPDFWKSAASGERQIKLEDARVLSNAAEQIRQHYSTVLEAGNRVLKNKNEPKLPERIREVFALAKDLKTPENDKDKLLPGSDNLLIYAQVFQLAEIKNLLDEWKKLKENLEPAAKSQ